MAFLHKERRPYEKKEHGEEDRYSSKPQKALLTGVAKFVGHSLCHLTSRLANVVRQGGREAMYSMARTTIEIYSWVL